MTRILQVLALTVAIFQPGTGAPLNIGDAARGEQLLRDRSCTACHNLDGQGGQAAPDLGRRISRSLTPAYLAGAIWNHAPTVWARVGSQSLSESEAADLFAFFSSRRYFERRGDAARGKKVFAAKHCASCHGVAKPESQDANPVAVWASLRDPVALAQATWNRPQLMVRAFDRKGIQCPPLTAQELTDLVIYLEHLRGVPKTPPRFYLASPQAGHELFRAKGCAGCHQGKLSLERRPRLTPVGLAAAWWNHNPKIAGALSLLTYEEADQIMSYLWSLDGRGDPARGRRVFARKGCVQCHAGEGTSGAGAAALSRREAAPVCLLAALWSHGPGMYAEIGRKGASWPHFEQREMADLIAYLEAGRQEPLAALR
ncbi:MAG: c-type cytochrome [Bryobacterales bacterium]|nr:c-type cytochrome [Bryobacterales bacterium]